MARFNITALANHQYLVDGQDRRGKSGEVVIDGTQWDEITAVDVVADAQKQFDAELHEFFKPVLDAAKDAKAALAKAQAEDPLSYYVVEEGVEARAGKPERRVRLNTGSQILRLIDQGETDRLLWVGDNLVIAAPDVSDALVPGEGLPTEGDDDAPVGVAEDFDATSDEGHPGFTD